MDKLNTVLLDSALAVVSQDTSTIEAYNQYQNYLRVTAPYDTDWIPYAIFKPTNTDNTVGIAAEYLVMDFYETTTVSGSTYYTYECDFPPAVVGSAKATKIEITIAFISNDNDIIGVSRYDETADGYNDTTYIAAQLLIDYPSAVSGDYVRVFNTETDWLFNGTAWTDQDEQVVQTIPEHRSDTIEYTLRKGNSTSRPTHAPTNTETIISQLQNKINASTALATFYTQAEVNALVQARLALIGGTMQGDINMDSNNITNAAEIETDILDLDSDGTYGKVSFDSANGIAEITLKSGVTLQVGHEQLLQAYNNTGATIGNGKVVSISGSSGTRPTIELATNTSSTISYKTIGVATEDIANVSSGKVTTCGLVRGLDTSGFTEGAILYLGLDGALTETAPTAPSMKIMIGVVVTTNAGNGIIFVCPRIFPNLQDLSDVHIGTLADRDMLLWDNTNERFYNSNLDTELADLVKSITMNSSTFVLTITYWDDSTDTIDLPTESSIVDISYDNTTKDLTFELRSGATTAVPLDAIITGLATETYVTNAINTLDTDLQGQIDDLETNKLPKDFSGFTAKATLVDNDIFVINDSAASNQHKKVTYKEIKDQIVIDGDIFDGSVDYGSDGLGAFQTDTLKIHATSNTTDSDLVLDFKTLVSNALIRFKVPSSLDDSTQDARITTDNGTTYYDIVDSNGTAVQGSTILDKYIIAYYDGTNVVLYEDSPLENDLPYTGSILAFNTPKNGVQASIAQESVQTPHAIKGVTIEQVLSNGDFSDGTTNLVAGASSITVTDNNLLVTGDGTSFIPFVSFSSDVNYQTSQDLLIKTRVRVTNADCVSIKIRSLSNITDITVQSTPTQNEWYDFSIVVTPLRNETGTILMWHQYADDATSSGKVMEIDYFEVIPIPSQWSTYTADEINAILQGEYIPQGTWGLGEWRELDQLLDNRNEFSAWTLGVATSVDLEQDKNQLPYLKLAPTGSGVANSVPTNLSTDTTYTVLFHIIKNTLSSSSYYMNVAGSVLSVIYPDYKGIYKYTITTPSTISSNTFRVLHNATTVDNETIFRQAILEGDWTHLTDEQALDIIQNQAYGTFNLDSIGFTSTGDNLLDIRKIHTGRLDNGVLLYSDTSKIEDFNLDTGYIKYITSTTFRGVVTDYISVMPNVDYVVSFSEVTNDSFVRKVSYYDDNKNYLSEEGGSSTVVEFSFTTPTNAKYVRININDAVGATGTYEITSFQLNIGTTALPYTPYKKSEYTLYTPQYGLNGIGDVYDDEDTQRFGVDYNDVVQNATGWSYVSVGNVDRFSNVLSSLLSYKLTPASVASIIGLQVGDDFFVRKALNEISTASAGYYIDTRDSDSRLYVALPNTLGITTSNDFETYLQANDVKFIYELDEYIPRTLENNNVLEQRGALLVSPYGQCEWSTPYAFTNEFSVVSSINDKAQTNSNTGAIVDLVKRDKAQDTRLDSIERTIEALNIGQEDDLRFSATALKQGATSKPDFDYTNIGLLFPQNDTTEAIYIVAQLPHDRLPNTDLEPHVHCRLSGSGQPVMKMDYKIYNPTDETIPASFTTYTMNVNTATWSSGTISNMIYGSAPIDGNGYGASAIMIIKLYRDDNVYSGDLLVDEFDIHYVKGRFGEDV